MTTLQRKIDFAIIMRIVNANPNGDPLNGNRPRTSFENYGEISDVCLKRKLRDRLLESGEPIFVQSDDRKSDEFPSLSHRAKARLGEKLDGPDTARLACEAWFDVRAFGQLFAIKSTKKKAKKPEDGEQSEGDSGVSIGIRGPVTLQSAFSIEPVDVTSTQITKSVSGEGDGSKRGSDTMGMKHRIDRGIYISFGSMSPQLAERTGFSDEDAQKIKSLLPKLFENDASSARPAGSMEVLSVIWWTHGSKAGVCGSAKVHRSLHVDPQGTPTLSEIEGVVAELINGF